MSDFHVYKHPMPLAAATMCFVVEQGYDNYVLVVKRREDANTYPGMWCFPGGFLEVGRETLEECASREMEEETGLIIMSSVWQLLMVQSNPKDDPRGHMINAVYTTKAYKFPEVTAADDVCEYRWVDIKNIQEEDLAFNHSAIATTLWLETYY